MSMGKPSKATDATANVRQPLDGSVYAHWSDHPLGQRVCLQEQLLYDDWVSNLFGYHALQLGDFSRDLLRNSRIQHCFHANRSEQLACESAFLPFPENSLDLVLLPHVLEFSDLPQQTLREVERVLMPEGHVMLTLFNPFSVWGIKRAMGCGKKDIPDLWQSHFFAMNRIKDWLSVLGFELIQSQTLCHEWPIHSEKMAQRLQFFAYIGLQCLPMTGGVYAILARKRVTGMHIIRPEWQALQLSKRLLARPHKKILPMKDQRLD